MKTHLPQLEPGLRRFEFGLVLDVLVLAEIYLQVLDWLDWWTWQAAEWLRNGRRIWKLLPYSVRLEITHTLIVLIVIFSTQPKHPLLVFLLWMGAFSISIAVTAPAHHRRRGMPRMAVAHWIDAIDPAQEITRPLSRLEHS